MRKRVGRPEINAGKKRESVFKFYATKAEATRLRNRAEELGQTISEYLRSVAVPKE